METSSIEMRMCEEYSRKTADETLLPQWWETLGASTSLLVPEGFEERSLGVMRSLARATQRVPALVLGRYVGDDELNRRHRKEFEALAEQLAPRRWMIVENHNDGAWVEDALAKLGSDKCVLDITGLSGRGIFGSLDALRTRGVGGGIVYSEAGEYWPKKPDWDGLLGEIAGDVDEDSLLAEKMDERNWLYSSQHHVELVARHEGYDSGAAKALLAFLPFKCARLAALLDKQDYSVYRFVAGNPRLSENAWRKEALVRINRPIVGAWETIAMDTFGYRDAFVQLASEVCGDEGLLAMYDVHLAPLGSKLQTVACWALSCLVPAITVVTSVTHGYFTEAFSEGVGESWGFPLALP